MSLVLALAVLIASGCKSAEPKITKPEKRQDSLVMPLWPGGVPDALPAAGPETVSEVTEPVAGRPWHDVQNVTKPAMMIFPAKGKNTGVAVLVFPGGGYEGLAIDLEGTEVCDWLTAKGITCVVLKYRVPHSGPHWDGKCRCQVMPKIPAALQDAQRAVSLMRDQAARWHVDPHKIGVLGFSAGGHLVAAVSTHSAERQYRPADAADEESSRPDFAVGLYPGHLFWGKDSWVENTLLLNPDIRDHISAETPPTFLLQNEDDRVDTVFDSLSYFAALRRAGVRAELHSYATGGHAFGLRRTSEAATEWPDLVERWLVSIGMVAR
ncbi:alpha/beta hydrolase [Sphingomonas sp. AR_OL41]|uniref:alpha/beta hydrolase n=1 Tax=Sphingomonas sp. AR_OL41 TaxID=3042729 RepID=UPI002480E0B9|nr:alpha/beta hydrolase [Sphingomonas sp. AR_OL41]MDH7971304.1 alpha/beta hydrolase [Sphingomonas sp. AR_OL41]